MLGGISPGVVPVGTATNPMPAARAAFASASESGTRQGSSVFCSGGRIPGLRTRRGPEVEHLLQMDITRLPSGQGVGSI